MVINHLLTGMILQVGARLGPGLKMLPNWTTSRSSGGIWAARQLVRGPENGGGGFKGFILWVVAEDILYIKGLKGCWKNSLPGREGNLSKSSSFWWILTMAFLFYDRSVEWSEYIPPTSSKALTKYITGSIKVLSIRFSTSLGYRMVLFGSTPHPVTVANESL